MHELSIGQLAKAANVSIDTIRFYEKSGLMPQPARRPSGFREYSQHDLRQLRLVRQARSLGFSIEEIFEILVLQEERDSGVASGVIERNLTIVNQKIHALRHWRRALHRLIGARRALQARSVLDCFDGAAIEIGQGPRSVERSPSPRDSA